MLRRRLVPVALTATVVLAFIGWWGSSSPGDAPLTSAEQMARTVAFNQATPVVLAPVLAHERTAALHTMKLPADQQATLEQHNGELVWLTLWDDRDEDGDIVTVQSDGFSQSVTLRHAPVRIAVPKPRGGVVTMTGTHDGGGGITVAVAAGGGSLAVPVLAVGQTMTVPVR